MNGASTVKEGRSVVSLRFTPAYRSMVGVCDAGFVGTRERVPFQDVAGPEERHSANPHLRIEMWGTRPLISRRPVMPGLKSGPISEAKTTTQRMCSVGERGAFTRSLRLRGRA